MCNPQPSQCLFNLFMPVKVEDLFIVLSDLSAVFFYARRLHKTLDLLKIRGFTAE